jgi:hypothetical protein
MTRTATSPTRGFLLLAAALGLGAAALVRPAPAAGPCPLGSDAHALHHPVMAERAPALRPALFTYADTELAEPQPAVSADAQWSRLSGMPGLHPWGTRL